MDLDCLICMEIFLNGLQTGTDVPIRTVVHGVVRVLFVCFVVVAGVTDQTISSPRVAITVIPPLGISIMVFEYVNWFFEDKEALVHK